MSTNASLDPTSGTDSQVDRQPENSIALCLSGGGYRAMVFHLGTLIRVNELSLLGKVRRVSSVSGGSITAGVLGLHWKDLAFDAAGVATRLDQTVVASIRELAGTTIDVGAVLEGVLPGVSVGDVVAKAYRKHLFGDATLQDLPSDAEGPRFVINATNVQTGVLFRFSRPYAGDYKLGRVQNPKIDLAEAVTASSAFPPVLSPFKLQIPDPDWLPGEGEPDLEPCRSQIVLSDGGVYDNLGLETAFKRHKTLLVSDGGKNLEPEASPAHDWLRHSIRVLSIIDEQVGSLRKRVLVEAFKTGLRSGTYIGIRTPLSRYPVPSPFTVDPSRATELANTPTRLASMPSEVQERLVNLGYVTCDVAIRSHYLPDAAIPRQMPYPAAGI